MDFGLLPPEVNSALMYAGPGSGPLLAAAAAWEAVATQLESAAGGYFSEMDGLTGLSWFGLSSMAMSAAAAPYVAWLQAAAVQAGITATQAYGAAAAYEAAYLMTVPPPVIAPNRTQLMVLVATNFFGQNGPAIAATEAHYMAMWAQDAVAMYGYAVDAAAASALQSYDEPPQTTNPAGQGAQSGAVAQSAANTVGAQTQSVVQQQLTSIATQQLTSTAQTQQLTSTAAPAASTQSVTPGATTPQSVTPGATTPQSVTPGATTPQSAAPAASTQ